MSDEVIQCPGCKGQKKVIKLGMMSGDCETCNGVGWIKKPVEETKVIVEQVIADKPALIVVPEEVVIAPKPKTNKRSGKRKKAEG